jgi:hypothetical protein
MGGHSDANDLYMQQADQSIRQLHIEIAETSANKDQSRLEQLMASGFAWEEAIKLLGMREHVYDNSEMRQRMENDPRVQFVRWLIENNEMNES